MKHILLVTALLATSLSMPFDGLDKFLVPGFRPPAVPLINLDPYMNVWQTSDNLSDVWPTLWDDTIKAFSGVIRIDGDAYRFMGTPNDLPQIQQTLLQVFPTRTLYSFEAYGVQLNVTFMSPLTTSDLVLLSTPITYITFDVIAIDDNAHSVQIYYDNTAEIAVNEVSEEVVWGRNQSASLNLMYIGTSAQNVLGMSGDWVGIDWGYAYVAVPNDDPSISTVECGSEMARTWFAQNGSLPSSDDTNMPRAASDNWPVLAVAWDLGNVDGSQMVTKVLMFGYDDIYSMNYYGTWMKGYWTQFYDSAVAMFESASISYDEVVQECLSVDYSILLEGYTAGGAKYATMLALSYRQVLAGCKLVWNEKLQEPWYFMKEISSDGDISTVDVVFPASPFFVVHSPELLKKLMFPLLTFANNETDTNYTSAFAPHHLGTWPIADANSGNQEDMPIEETGNMLMMIATIVSKQNDASFVYPQYWPLLESWGEYLVQNLPDPGDQLCTDDFEGYTPHDANLAVKGIVGLDCMAYLYEFLGNDTMSGYYRGIAYEMAIQWIQLANPNDTNHYALQYNKEGWSLKYNLLYQRVLDLETFPESVFNLELSFYPTQQETYGVPLDLRHPYTKLDWEFWTAALYPDEASWYSWLDFLYMYADQTPSRVALSDWYNTQTGAQQGFQARTVVGGLWAKLAV